MIEDEFMDRPNQALAGAVFPIEIYTAPDPSWGNYEAFKKGLRTPMIDDGTDDV
jgi:hypothetical protein